MSKPPRRRKSLPKIRSKKTTTDIEKTATEKNTPENDVGYGNPPRNHQFKPGQSGNPKGRPKGAKNEATILYELLHRKISIRESGKTRKITILEAILMRHTEKSVGGDIKSATFILNRYGASAAGEPQRSEFPDIDHEILEDFARRLMAQRAIEELRP